MSIPLSTGRFFSDLSLLLFWQPACVIMNSAIIQYLLHIGGLFNFHDVKIYFLLSLLELHHRYLCVRYLSPQPFWSHFSSNTLSYPLHSTFIFHLLGDRGEAIFKGRIRIPQHAQLTDSDQICRTIMLGDRARIIAMPTLEITADNVVCRWVVRQSASQSC